MTHKMTHNLLLKTAFALIAIFAATNALANDRATIREIRGTKIKHIDSTSTHVRIQANRIIDFRADVYGDIGDIQQQPRVIAWVDEDGKVRYNDRVQRSRVKAFEKGMIRYLSLSGLCNSSSDVGPGKCIALEEQSDGDIHMVVFELKRNEFNEIEVWQGVFATNLGRDYTCTKKEIRRGTAYCDIGGRSSIWGLAKRLAESERDRSVIYTKESRAY